jgi:lipopolysaccharide transport system ATP-binding protein
VVVEVAYWNLSDSEDFRPSVNLHFSNAEGVALFTTWDANNMKWRNTPRGRQLVRTRCRIPAHFFAEGVVFITTNISSLQPTRIHLSVPDAVAIHVLETAFGNGVRGEYTGDWPGAVRPLLDWEVRTETAGS